jgi:hypothetical protein
VSPTSPASLSWTRQLGTDTHALSSRPSPMPPSSIWADDTNTNEPDDTGIDKASFTYIASHASLYDRGPDSSDCVGSNTLLSEELETSAAWLKRPAHALAAGIDNVFFPGRAAFTADSMWMPSPSLLEEDGPMLTGATSCGPILEACSPMLSDDGIEFFEFITPWTGAKQVSFLLIPNPRLQNVKCTLMVDGIYTFIKAKLLTFCPLRQAIPMGF